MKREQKQVSGLRTESLQSQRIHFFVVSLAIYFAVIAYNTLYTCKNFKPFPHLENEL